VTELPLETILHTEGKTSGPRMQPVCPDHEIEAALFYAFTVILPRDDFVANIASVLSLILPSPGDTLTAPIDDPRLPGPRPVRIRS
jgi:hypothetical protein